MARILIVDDEAAIREMIREILARDQHDIDVADNGSAGLKQFQNKSYDLVITDLIMPEKEGLEFISDLKGTNTGVKILAISGGARMIDAEPHLEIAVYLGADASLKKPFEMNDLMSTVNRLLSL